LPCGARRMAETAALLADEVLPERPLRQWVSSLPRAGLTEPLCQVPMILWDLYRGRLDQRACVVWGRPRSREPAVGHGRLQGRPPVPTRGGRR